MNGAAQYRKMNAQTSIVDASPHQLVQLMFDGALARLAATRGHMERDAHEAKNETMKSAMAIIGGLQGCLDFDKGGELARNLDALYDYMQRRLLTALVANEPAGVTEVMDLLVEVKSGWDAIADEVRDLDAATA